MEAYWLRTQNNKEQEHEFENNLSSPRRGITDLQTATTLTKVGNNQGPKKVLVGLCVICVAFGVAIITLSVMVNSLRIDLKMATEKQQNLEVNLTLLSGKVDTMKTMNTTLFGFDIEQKFELQAKQMAQMTSAVNTTMMSYLQNMDKSSEKVSLTACSQEKTYSTHSIIAFPSINQKTNVSDAVISAVRSNGSFSVEKTGLYLITVFIMTDTHNRNAALYVDNHPLAYLYISLTTGAYQTSSVTVLQNLDINDRLYVKNADHGSMHVYGDPYSCLSILQLS